MIIQVADGLPGMDDNSLPNCGWIKNTENVGQPAELLPASLMPHKALQDLQLQLVPFQVTPVAAATVIAVSMNQPIHCIV